MMPGPITEVERIVALEAGVAEVKRDVHEIRADIATMRDSLTKRPSWAVSVIITVLSSACVGLVVALANQMSP